MRNGVEFEIRLPKGVRVKDIRTGAIPIDENWMTTVRENHKNIDELRVRDARRKYA